MLWTPCIRAHIKVKWDWSHLRVSLKLSHFPALKKIHLHFSIVFIAQVLNDGLWHLILFIIVLLWSWPFPINQNVPLFLINFFGKKWNLPNLLFSIKKHYIWFDLYKLSRKLPLHWFKTQIFLFLFLSQTLSHQTNSHMHFKYDQVSD